MCPLRPARSPWGRPSRLGPGKPCVSRVGVTNLHTAVILWTARAVKVTGAPGGRPRNGTAHLHQPGSGEASGAVATLGSHWPQGHGHRMCACALGRVGGREAGAPGSLGRPGTGLIWPWTQCQRTGRWKGGCGCHSSSLRTGVSRLCTEPQCLSWHGLSGRKVWGHCGGWACQGAHTGTTGWGTSPGILQARGSCSPGLLAVGRPVPGRGPIAPSEHGKGTPRGHGQSACLLGPSVRASLRSHLVEEAWDGHLCPRGSLSGREGRAEAPPAESTPPCRPSGPTNVPLSRKWTPQVLGAVVPGQVHGGQRVPLCCPPVGAWSTAGGGLSPVPGPCTQAESGRRCLSGDS